MTIAEHSCLAANQSGLESPAALALEEAEETVELEARRLGLEVVKSDDMARVAVPEDIELPAGLYSTAELNAAMKLGVAPPKWTSVRQCRAASRARRSAANISYIVWHTPEGSEAGSLSVLNGTGAGFDVFVPTNGNMHKCNDWWNYIAWQAGDWAYNQASIGIEMGDYAARSGSWPEWLYDRLAFVCAWMGEVCGVPVRNGARGVPGYIDHAEITPGWRTDPGANFPRAKMLQKIADIRGGRVSPVTPTPTPTAQKAEMVYVVAAAGSPAEKIANAFIKVMREGGFPKDKIGVWTKPADVRWASYRARHGRLGQFVCIIAGTSVLGDLHPDATKALRGSNGAWYPVDQSDLWDVTDQMQTKFRWRIATLAKRHGLKAAEILSAFEKGVSGKA